MKQLISILFILLSVSIFAQETSYVCAGSTKNFTASCSGGTGPYSYSWLTPSSTTISTATINASVAGTYTWTCTDANGCTATGTHVLNIEADPTASLVINASNACINTNQTISATGVPSGYTYSWTFGAGATPSSSTNSSEVVSYSTAGTKTITMTISRTLDGTQCDATCQWVKTTTIVIGSVSGNSTCN